eukprot:1928793-Rhodomonas_salina.3
MQLVLTAVSGADATIGSCAPDGLRKNARAPRPTAGNTAVRFEVAGESVSAVGLPKPEPCGLPDWVWSTSKCEPIQVLPLWFGELIPSDTADPLRFNICDTSLLRRPTLCGDSRCGIGEASPSTCTEGDGPLPDDASPSILDVAGRAGVFGRCVLGNVAQAPTLRWCIGQLNSAYQAPCENATTLPFVVAQTRKRGTIPSTWPRSSPLDSEVSWVGPCTNLHAITLLLSPVSSSRSTWNHQSS